MIFEFILDLRLDRSSVMCACLYLCNYDPWITIDSKLKNYTVSSCKFSFCVDLPYLFQKPMLSSKTHSWEKYSDEFIMKKKGVPKHGLLVIGFQLAIINVKN